VSLFLCLFEGFGPLLFEPCPTLISPLTPDFSVQQFSVFVPLQIQALPERGNKSNAVMSEHNPEADS